MSTDCQFPSPLDILIIYDNTDTELMRLPVCEVIKGDVEGIDKDVVKMRSFVDGAITPYTRDDFLLLVQDSFQQLNVAYVEIILRDETKVRI